MAVIGSVRDVLQWHPGRLADLVELTKLALPDEAIRIDDLHACCADRPGVILAMEDGCGAVVVSVDQRSGVDVGVVELLVVIPAARRRGTGRALLKAAEQWLFDHRVAAVTLGAVGSLHLWPGVDVAMTEMIGLASSAGYRSDGIALGGVLSGSYRSGDPAPLPIRRILEDRDGDLLGAYVRRRWPGNAREVELAIAQGTCHGAFDGDSPVGFVCHSLNRLGWIGPLVVDPRARRRGVGSALVAAASTDLMVAGVDKVGIVPAGSLGFLDAGGGRVDRVFRRFVRSLEVSST